MDTSRGTIQVLPTNLGNGVFSPDRNGLGQIIFEIPKIPQVLNGRSLRVNGTFKVKLGNGSDTANGQNFCAENPTSDIYMDGRTGVSSVIETLSIQSLVGATYSTIKNYNRLCASMIPLNESINNFLNGVDTMYGGLAKDVSTAKKCDKAFDFSLPLLDGFLQGNPIDMNLVGGLRIVITLAPANYVLNNNYWRNQNSTAGLSNGGAYYEISDLICSMETEIPNAQGQEAMLANQNGVMEYNTFSSFYNVIVSNDHNLSLLFNTSRTLSVIGNIIPSEWVNSYEYNSQSTLQPLSLNSSNVLENSIPVNSFTYTKAGVRIPLDFELTSRETQKLGVADSYKNWEELNIIRNTWDIHNMVKSLKTELSNPLDGGTPARFNRSRYSIVEEDKVQSYMVGVNYDSISEVGINFKGEPFGMRLQMTKPTGQSVKPHSLFLFVKHENSIMFQNGVATVMN
tara:strand:+ start:764 stop:2128 length:1365 start_codon:yes stop_codon:yes gene_type:complete